MVHRSVALPYFCHVSQQHLFLSDHSRQLRSTFWIEMPSLGLNKIRQRLLLIRSKKHDQDEPRGIDRIDSSFGDEAWIESEVSMAHADTESHPYPIADTSELDSHARLSTLRYKPLNEAKDDIRILNIISEPGDEHVTCTLAHFSCSHKYPDYKALSYCWGTLLRKQFISLSMAHQSRDSKPGSSSPIPSSQWTFSYLGASTRMTRSKEVSKFCE